MPRVHYTINHNIGDTYMATHETYTGNYIKTNSIGADISDLEGITSISGVLYLYDGNLTNVDELSALASVGSGFLINDNDLTNIDGLSALAHVGGAFWLHNNNLTNVDALSNLASIGESFNLYNNPTLSDLSGLNTSLVVTKAVRFDNTGVTTVEGLGYVPDMSFGHSDVDGHKYGRDRLEAAGYGDLLTEYYIMHPDGRVLPGEQDLTPDIFTLNTNSNVLLGIEVESNVITVSGLEPYVLVDVLLVSNGQTLKVNKNGSGYVPYSSGLVSVENGDTLQFSIVSPGALAITYTTTITIGNRSVDWLVRTPATNAAPAITGVAPMDILAYPSSALNIVVPSDLFTDTDGHVVTLTYSGLPAFLSVTGGVISGTPAFSQIGSYVVVITGTDPFGAFNHVSFNIVIEAFDVAAEVDGIDTRIDTLEAIKHVDLNATSISIGAQSKAGSYSVSIGLRAESGKFATAVGLDSDAAAFRSVALGNNATTEERYEVRLGGETFERSTGLFAGRGFVTVHPNQAGLETRDHELVSKKWADAQIAILIARIEALEE